MEKTGFWLDIYDPWLGGAPDGIVVTPTGKGFLEIKCPYSGKDMTIQEMIKQYSWFCLRLDEEGKYDLKQEHNYYY